MSSYINHYAPSGGALLEPRVTVDWAAITRQRLRWLYGPDYDVNRAAQTSADLASWNRLGEGRRPAA